MKERDRMPGTTTRGKDESRTARAVEKNVVKP